MTADYSENSKKKTPPLLAGAGGGWTLIQFVQELPETFPYKAELLGYVQNLAPFITIVFVFFGFRIQAWWDHRRLLTFQQQKTQMAERLDQEIKHLEAEIETCDEKDKPELMKSLAKIKREKVKISESFLQHHLEKYKNLDQIIK